MSPSTKIRRLIAGLLIVSTSGVAVPPPVQAAMVSTDAAVVSPGAQREKIAAMLYRADVSARLAAYGVAAADLEARVAALTDDEAAALAERIEELPAGGIIDAILFVFLVLLITDILGLTKIFPFTRPVR